MLYQPACIVINYSKVYNICHYDGQCDELAIENVAKYV